MAEAPPESRSNYKCRGSPHGRGQGRWRGNWRGGRGQGNWRGRGRYQPWSRGQNRTDQAGSSSNSQPVFSQTTMYDVPSPFYGWKLYFPEEVYADNNPVLKMTEAFMQYFSDRRNSFNKDEILQETKSSFSVDFKELAGNRDIIKEFPHLASQIRENPDKLLAALGLALHQIFSTEEAMYLGEESGFKPEVPFLCCRLHHYEPVTPVRQLKANYFGKFVSIKGTVVRVSRIKPFCTQLVFQCATCSNLQVCKLPDGKFTPPKSCPTPNCQSRTFVPCLEHTKTKTVDWQIVRIQEILGDSQRDSGRIPRTMDCELTNDLVESCIPGDIVTVAGEVKVHNTTQVGRQKDKCMFILYILANSISSNKSGATNKTDSAKQKVNTDLSLGVEFTDTDLCAVREIQSDSHVFRLLIHSLCPSIYGHEMVKAALILALFGGTQKFANDPNKIPVRGDPHVLVVGDPGLGKSQLLQAAASVAPRSVYVCGNTSTASGLTVTLVRDGAGEHALEAGALVLADNGCCCIDEFDKMNQQHQALLEAMEQQSISMAKAGIVCSLPARTSIIAAANPVGGHYNKAKTVAENLRLGGALLSRFDLVFILLDKPDEELDAMLSEHVMAMHSGRKSNLSSITSTQVTHTPVDDPALRQWQADKPLSERLKVPRGEVIDPIPHQLMRKYIAYARERIHPKILPEAAQVLQDFYIDLRKKHHTKDSTPITTRQLESMIRLTEARARLELRKTCTAKDAQDIVELMKHSMADTYSDASGFLDFSRSHHGSGMSSKARVKKFIAALQQVYESTYNSLFTVQEMRDLAQRAQLDTGHFQDFISVLNTQGFLLKKGPGVYQLQTAGY